MTDPMAPATIHTHMTKAEFQGALPRQIRGRVSTEVMRGINDALQDEMTREHFRENLLGYTQILLQGKWKLQSYIDAVKFVGYRLLGYHNQESYAKTFPDRYNRLISQGVDDKVISSYVHAFKTSKLVNAIYEQTLIPVHVLNADNFQKAINKQVALMNDPKVSHKVQSDAANSLLTHLKPPEKTKIELDVSVAKDSTLQDLRDSIRELAEVQRDAIMNKTLNATEVAKSTLTRRNGEEATDVPT